MMYFLLIFFYKSTVFGTVNERLSMLKVVAKAIGRYTVKEFENESHSL